MVFDVSIPFQRLLFITALVIFASRVESLRASDRSKGATFRIHLRSTALSESNTRFVRSDGNESVSDSLSVGIPPPMSWRWGHAAGKTLYMMSYDGRIERAALARMLIDKGSLVGGYVPDRTWIVAADAASARSAAALPGVKVVKFLPVLKMAPEWSRVLPAVRMAISSNAHRRRLSGQMKKGNVTNTWIDSLHIHIPLRKTGLSPRLVILASFPHGLIKAVKAGRDMGQRVGGGAGPRSRPSASRWDLPRAAAKDWEFPLAQTLQDSGSACSPLLTPAGLEGLQVAICPQDLETTMQWLANQPLVHFVAPVPRVTTSNLLAGIITQTGGWNATRGSPTQAVNQPFWRMGLDGTGQVVGVADTGLSVDSCFFFDPQNPITAADTTMDSKTQIPVIRPNIHRKLVQYYGYQGFQDEVGHGTHVTGTVAGSPLWVNESSSENDPNMAKGTAPGAKIAFFDIFNGNPQQSLATPTDLIEGLYQVQYAAGARIQSDSWGFQTPYAYTDASSQVDMFTWRHPDFLSVLAAGNNAINSTTNTDQFVLDEFGLLPGGTVQSPASAKNVLAVGSVYNYVPPGPGSPLIATFTATNSSTGKVVSKLMVTLSVSLDYGSHLSLLGLTLPVEISRPYQACSPQLLTDNTNQGKVIILGRGGCTFSQKASNTLAAGALSIIVINNQSQALLPGVNPLNLRIPISAINLDQGRSIIELLGITLPDISTINPSTDIMASDSPLSTSLRENAAAAVTLTVMYQPADPTIESFHSVPDYSSYGPMADGRIKPDIVAPGDSVLSCFKTGPMVGAMDNCATARMKGTSMSAPVVAGAAALARQYFTAGYYPTGAPRARNRYATPSGMLLKAVLIAGAAEVTGNTSLLGLSLTFSPLLRSRFTGFGCLDLSRSLPLLGNLFDPGFNLQVVDMVLIQEGEVHTYTLVSSGGPLSVALVWYDYPADVISEVALVNDLDLAVVVTSNVFTSKGAAGNVTTASSKTARRVFLGNGPSSGGGERDRRNTVERVTVQNVAFSSVIEITVNATSIESAALDPNTPQRYALVVVGAIRGTIASPYNPASRLPFPPSPPSPPNPPRQPSKPLPQPSSMPAYPPN